MAWEDQGGLNFVWASAIIDQLVAHGVRAICLSPGFRNSPLILAAQLDSRIQAFTILDERASAFFALGLAKQSGAPVAVACTSGTACANFFPAILEAEYSHTPLVVLTADRPQRLSGLGSNQTMDQIRLFGEHVRFFSGIEAPGLGMKADFPKLQYTIAKAVHAASGSGHRGPVHVNIAFEEPLLPRALPAARPQKTSAIAIQVESARVPAPEVLARVREKLEQAQCPVFVLGPERFDANFLRNVASLAERLGTPLLAEASTGASLRALGKERCGSLITHVEGLTTLVAGRFDLVVRFGSVPVSKKLQDFLDGNPAVPTLLFDEPGEWRNPSLGSATYVDCGSAAAAAALAQMEFSRKLSAENLCVELGALEKQHETAIANRLAQTQELTEWHALEAIVGALPDAGALFIGNSMPIRDLNFIAGGKIRTEIFHNRGLSGIDGLLATACGVAAGNQKPTALVLGDLSLVHDVGSLAILKNFSSRLQLKVFVMNNGGGDIFRRVGTKNFDPAWFTTPQSVDFSQIAAGFGIPYSRIDRKAALVDSLHRIFSEAGVSLCEIVPDLAANERIRS